ncbi:hypothetical protein NL452_05195, partial [Klebsiella pneumoniae]|nr:hypothetical protein [Klebsiella pneumoniae]
TDGDGSHGSTSKTPSYTKSVSWHHYQKTHTYIARIQTQIPNSTHSDNAFWDVFSSEGISKIFTGISSFL